MMQPQPNINRYNKKDAFDAACFFYCCIVYAWLHRVFFLAAIHRLKLFSNAVYTYDTAISFAAVSPYAGLAEHTVFDADTSRIAYTYCAAIRLASVSLDFGWVSPAVFDFDVNLTSEICFLLYTYDADNCPASIDPENAVHGFVATHYEYDPCGYAVQSTCKLAAENPFRFSTKYLDAETGLYYYGYRYYSPVIGRWLNRDPLEEDGGNNVYGFIDNNPISNLDPIGLWKIYDFFESNPNYRLEISLSALTRKYDLPRIPYLHKKLNSYGVIFEAKHIKKDERKCVQVNMSFFAAAGGIKDILKSGLNKLPSKSLTENINVDVTGIMGAKAIDCECFSKDQVMLGVEGKIQFQGGYGPILGYKPEHTTDYRTGKGGVVDRLSVRGIRGPYVGIYADIGISPILSDKGFAIEVASEITGFIGNRTDVTDFRAGGTVSGKATYEITPNFKSKADGFDASFL